MMPQWREPQPGDNGKYAFLEKLGDDAPPTLLRAYKPVKFDQETACHVVDSHGKYQWQYWTVAGWPELSGRVCVCERPSSGKAGNPHASS